MKLSYYILLLLLAASCATVKKSHTQTVVTTHDSVVHDVQQVHDTSYRYTIKEVHDTVIKVQRDTVQLKLKAADLQPLQLINGRKAPRHFTADNGDAHATVDVDTEGNLTVRCNTDSLQMVISNITREKDSLYSSFDSMRAANESIKTATTSITADKLVKRQPWWWLIIAFLLGLLTAWLIKLIVSIIKYHAT